MPSRVAETVVRRRPFGRPLRVRVELHGVSVMGPGDRREVMRWEWIERVSAGTDGVVLAGGGHRLAVPAGAFGLSSDDLAARIELARDTERRTDVIAGLLAGAG